MNALTRRNDNDSNVTSQINKGAHIIVPNFDDSHNSLSEDLYEDWLCILASENMQRIHDAAEWDHAFLTSATVQYIFTVCVRLRLPHEVKYLAALIYNDFMLTHVDDLYKVVYESSGSNEQKMREWKQIEANLSRQTTLRMLSAIQIASKLHSFHDSLSRKLVRFCLKTLGYAYTEDSIMHSEIRVLTSIDWKISYRQTPLVYAETLLKMLERRSLMQFDAATYWQFILLCMDCVFMFWDDILKRLLMNILGSAGYNFPRYQLCRVRADWMLLGASIVAAAAGCADGAVVADQVIQELHEIGGTPLDDITDMCVAIVECIVEKHRCETMTTNSHSPSTPYSSSRSWS
uniref:Cyclin N-terminal domain-containing protein 1 n=2 Tax=Ascaris TaxID=6251 RepID=F1L9Y5_ASCSU